jgi:hypothetical protein
MASRHDGPLRTALAKDRAKSNEQVHKPEWHYVGRHRILSCKVCYVPYPCWFVRDAQEVLDEHR